MFNGFDMTSEQFLSNMNRLDYGQLGTKRQQEGVEPFPYIQFERHTEPAIRLFLMREGSKKSYTRYAILLENESVRGIRTGVASDSGSFDPAVTE